MGLQILDGFYMTNAAFEGGPHRRRAEREQCKVDKPERGIVHTIVDKTTGI
jgi:hypothetical protein